MQVTFDIQPVLTVLMWLIPPTAVVGALWKGKAFTNQSRAAACLALLSGMGVVGASGYQLYNSEKFSAECSDYLVAAYKADSLKDSIKHAKQAHEFLSSNDMTSGYSTVLFRSPEQDVGEFFGRVSKAVEALEAGQNKSRSDAKPFWRDILTSSGVVKDAEKDGSKVTAQVPFGISNHPINSVMALAFAIALTLFGGSVFWMGRNAVKKHCC